MANAARQVAARIQRVLNRLIQSGKVPKRFKAILIRAVCSDSLSPQVDFRSWRWSLHRTSTSA
eukprot:4758267-Karenia_brevis.AAC.1